MESMPVTDYPDLPITLKTQAVGVEVYTIGLAKVNKRAANAADTSDVVFIDGTVDTADKFLPFQGYAYVRSNEETGDGTIFLIGGVGCDTSVPPVCGATAQSKIYGIDITVGDDKVVSAAINEYQSDKTETFVAPLVATAKDGKVFVLGGRKATATKFAHLISKDAYDEWPGEAPNLFLGTITTGDDSLYASSGFELPNGAGSFSWVDPHQKVYRFNLGDSSTVSGEAYFTRLFHDIAFFPTKSHVAIIGGINTPDLSQTATLAIDYYEFIDRETMSFKPEELWGQLSQPRALHRVAVTADTAFIVGGMEDLKGTAPAELIELFPASMF
jgi:hypothetical protein